MDQLPLLTDGTGGEGGKVVQLRLADVRDLADTVASSSPEFGRRTPQVKLNRYSPRTFADMTLGDVKNVLRKARKEGRTEDLADLWATMMEDAHLDSVWQTFVAPIIGARFEVNPAEVDQELEAAADLAARGCEEVLRGIEYESLVSALLDDGEGIGYGVAEIEWTNGRLLGQPAIVPRAITPILARRFAWSDDWEIGLWDEGTAVGALKAKGAEPDVISGRGATMARLPAGKYIVHQPMRFHAVQTGRGVIFAIAKWWWIKQIVAQSALQGSEAFANPRFIAHVEQVTAGDPIVDDLLAGLENFATDGYAVLRGKTKIDVIDAKGEGAAKTWDMFLKWLDAAMSKGVLGSTLNVEVGDTGGNRSLGESQAEQTMDPRRVQAAASVHRTIRCDLFTYVVRFNPHIFLPGTPLPLSRSVMAEETVEVDDTLVNAGGVTVDELRESRGLAPWGGERGERVVQPAAPGAFAADPTPVAAAPTQAPEVAAADDPFSATAAALSRVLSQTPSP